MKTKANLAYYREVPVIGKNARHLVTQPKFTRWFDTNELSDQIAKIEIIKAWYRGNPRVLTRAVVDCYFKDEFQGPCTVLIRGLAVANLIVIEDLDSGVLRGLVVKQERFAVGKRSFYEIVAGFVDDNEDPRAAAARETNEETPLQITVDQIKYLGQVRLSPGITDETIAMCYTPLTMTWKDVVELNGRTGGLLEEDEQTSCAIVELWRLPEYAGEDAKSMATFEAYKRLLRNQ